MLSKKLRLTGHAELVVIHGPASYRQTIGDLPGDVKIRTTLGKNHPFIHVFVKNKAELEKNIKNLAAATAPGGSLWISYPKGSSGIQTDLTRDKGWECLEKLNMEWVSLVSFDDTWSAFMLRNTPPKKQSKASEDYHSIQQAYADPKTKTVIVPEDLQKSLNGSKKAKAAYEALSYSCRKEYVLWIVGAKRDETRADRVKKTIEKLVAGKKNPTEK